MDHDEIWPGAMKRLFKWLVVFIFSLLFLVVIILGIGYYYKSEILEAIDVELKKSLNGEILMGGVGFSVWDEGPGISITLHDLELRGPYYGRYGKDFFRARKVYISVRVLPLLRKHLVVRSIRITEASMFIYRTVAGQSNLEIFRKQPADTVSQKDPLFVFLRKLQLSDVTVAYRDSLKQKSIGVHFIDVGFRIDQRDSSTTFAIDGPLKFEGLLLNPEKGSYLTEKAARVAWRLEFQPSGKILTIHPSTMQFANSLVNLDGRFEFTGPGKLFLHIRSPELDYAEGVSLLTQALQSKLGKIELERPVDMETTVDGTLAAGAEPKVDVRFRFSDAHLSAFGISSDETTLAGSFSNHIDSTKENTDPNSRIKIDSFKGKFQGLPTQLKATLDDLKNPRVDVVTSMDVGLTDFQPLVDSNQYKLGGGRFKANFEFAGSLKEFLDTTKTRMDGRLKGSAEVKDGVFRLMSRRQVYDKINVAVNFDQGHVAIENVSFRINNSPVTMKGELLGFVPFLVLPGEKGGTAKLSVYSPSLNLESILSGQKSVKPKSPKTVQEKTKVFNTWIEKLSGSVDYELKIKVDRLTYQNMTGSQVAGNFRFRNYTFEAQQMAMNLAGGRISVAFSLADLHKPVYYLWMKSTIRHADVKKLFYSFNDFKLTVITHDNLEGTVDMQTVLRSRVDDGFNLLMPTLTGNLDLSLKNGRVLNFEPLENMSNFLFKKRDFSDVQFGEIKSHIDIAGKEFDISRMEVESTVLRLFVEGRYSLAGHTDLSVQVPLSNLKKRNKDYKPENVGVDKRVGASVFLHVHNDETGKTVISYDPFKRHAKKNSTRTKATSN